MWGVDLQAKALDAGRGVAEGALVIGPNVAVLFDPAVRFCSARPADDREDADQRGGGGNLRASDRRSAVPDIGEDASVPKRHEHLRGLIVGRAAPEVPRRWESSDFPPAGKNGHPREIDVDPALEGERRLDAFQMNARAKIVIAANGDVGLP